MPLHLYSDIYASGSVPEIFEPMKGEAIKYPVSNKLVLKELRRLNSGKWIKVIKLGNVGEVHYFEHESGHESGSVAGVKYLNRTKK